ncbi:hypothetical protein D1007_52032 [Hordeum vulgare]|nr:hypothetical protein D1007_52032 [Hordeum vulgare]
MADAHRARAKRRATRVAQTVPISAAGACRSPSLVMNAATGPEVQEQQGSSQPVAARPLRHSSALQGRHRTLDRRLHGRRALAMATELLRYSPACDCHNDWLQRIEELVAAVGDSAALSCSLRPQPSLPNDEEQDTPPPPPRRGANPEPRQEARPRGRHREPRVGPGDEASYQVVPRPRADARLPPALHISRHEQAPLEAG